MLVNASAAWKGKDDPGDELIFYPRYFSMTGFNMNQMAEDAEGDGVIMLNNLRIGVKIGIIGVILLGFMLAVGGVGDRKSVV